MDPTPDGTAEDVRVAEIRLDIERTRRRIVETIDALEYKADVPSRLADVLSTTAANITARVLQRFPSAPRTSIEKEAGEQPQREPEQPTHPSREPPPP